MAITPPWALHVGAPNCFNRPIAIGMATTVTAGDTSVTFTAIDGQVVTFTDNSTNATFTGQISSADAPPASGDESRASTFLISLTS